ncbi:hypothetical protein R1sor_016459 [Riccia sorocarpa]|uniref:Uncharacterized protein n=1 Tax=Riccia sorocarpa TaxID=122646 RepID=A0ABD3HF16_9MARC
MYAFESCRRTLIIEWALQWIIQPFGAEGSNDFDLSSFRDKIKEKALELLSLLPPADDIVGVTVDRFNLKSPMGSKLPELDPVVIPFISHKPFDCEGNGLTYIKFSRESLDDLRTWLQPNQRSKPLFKRGKEWWRAQLLLYGLDAGKSTAKANDLTRMLRSAVKQGLQGPTQTIIDLEDELNAKFRAQNAEARDKKYQTLETEESRVEFYPVRFWRERFPSKGKRKKNDIVTLAVQSQSVHRVKTAAESLGLSVICPDAVEAGGLSKIVVGTDRGAVLQLKSQMEEKQKKQIEEAAIFDRKEREAKTPKLEAQVGPGKRTLKDVVGEWNVRSRAISDMWPDFGTDFQMSIYFHKLVEARNDSDEERSFCSDGSHGDGATSAKSDGTELVWANFEMGILSGVLQAKKHFPHDSSFPRGPIPFAWRGREAGEGEIQVDMDGSVNKGTVTFLGPTKLKGELKSSLGDFKFEGNKASSAPKNKNPHEWHELDEGRWNEECTGRW